MILFKSPNSWNIFFSTTAKDFVYALANPDLAGGVPVLAGT